MLNKYLVEFLGTFFVLFIVIYTGNFLAIGGALALTIYLGGGNFNPAVSIMMAVAKKLPKNELVGLISAQILGALAAFGLYNIIKTK